MTYDLNSVYSSGGAFLKAVDVVASGPQVYTINAVEVVPMKDGKKKLCVTFTEIEQSFLLNKTNALIVGSAYGSDFSKWAGKKLKLMPGKTTFEGRLVDCINVVTSKAVQKAPEPVHDDMNDSIPF